MRGFSILAKSIGAVPGQVRDLATGLFRFDVFTAMAEERIERETTRGGRASVALIQIGSTDHTTTTLRRMADAIRDALRPYDLVGYDTGRFVVLLDRCERDEAKQVCARMLRALAGVWADGAAAPSVGIASTPDDGRNLDALIDRAGRQVHAIRPMANLPQPVSA